MASELRVDKIIPTSGVPTGGGGGIIQTVFGEKSGEVTTSNTSTYVDTGLNATITPKFSSSKILVMIDQVFHVSRSSNTANGGFKVLRGSTVLALPNATQSNGATPYGLNYQVNGASYIGIVDRWTWQSLDSPATTSAVTYKVQMACMTSADSGRIRAQYVGTSGEQKSHIILMEVSA